MSLPLAWCGTENTFAGNNARNECGEDIQQILEASFARNELGDDDHLRHRTSSSGSAATTPAQPRAGARMRNESTRDRPTAGRVAPAHSTARRIRPRH